MNIVRDEITVQALHVVPCCPCVTVTVVLAAAGGTGPGASPSSDIVSFQQSVRTNPVSRRQFVIATTTKLVTELCMHSLGSNQ